MQGTENNEAIEGEILDGHSTYKKPIFQYQVVNTLTGEIHERELFSIAEIADNYQQLDADIKTMKRAQDKMKAYLEAFLEGTNLDVFELPDRRQIKYFYRQVKQINKEDLAKFLDADTIDAVMKVDNKAAKEVIVEMAQRGELPPDAWKEIDAGSTVTSSSRYVRIIKQ